MSTTGEGNASSLECALDPIETVNDITIEHAYSEDRDITGIRQHEVNSTSTTPVLVEEVQVEMFSVPEPAEVNTLKVDIVPEKVKSRELKSLLDAAKESNLDTNIVHKRESRRNMDLYNSRSSDSEAGRRAMRSQNPDFVAKHQKFLHSVQKMENNNETVVQDDESSKKDKDNTIANSKTPKKRKDNSADSPAGGSGSEDTRSRKSMKLDAIAESMRKRGKDAFCWRCHREGVLVACETCPRSYHHRCLKQPIANIEHWPCPECVSILQAESTRTRSRAMRDMSLEHLCDLLKFAVKRMMNVTGVEPFLHPVDTKSFPDYENYVVHPMDLTTMDNHIRTGYYGSTIAFTADAKWLLHNSIIFNSTQSKLTQMAKSLIKICKQEMYEIETCAECYLNANTKPNSWFVEVCTKPHVLLWAKLKGFPYWPAKAMIINNAAHVDVRFFGAHDRAWIPVKDCYLYSKKDPNTTNKVKRNNITECIKEVNIYIRNMRDQYGDFYYAPYRTPYDPTAELEQLTYMLPGYIPVDNATIPRRVIAGGVAQPVISDDDSKKKTKSRASSEVREQKVRKRSRSRAASEVRDKPAEEMDQLSILMNYPHKEMDKFVDGMEDDNKLLKELENRKKLLPIEIDSDDDDCDNKSLLTLRNEELKNGKSIKRYTNKKNCTPSVARGKVRTRGGYHNVTGKLKVLGSRTYAESRKRTSSSPMYRYSESPRKVKRRNSDVSSKSDSSRLSGISDTVNRVEELSDTREVLFTNPSIHSSPESSMSEKRARPEFVSTIDKPDETKLKSVIQINTGELYKNKEFKILQSKTISMAEQLMKKIAEQDGNIVKIEDGSPRIVGKRSSSSPGPRFTKIKRTQSTENVTSSDCNEKRNYIKEEKLFEANKDLIQCDEHSYSTPAMKESPDKNQNVTSSTECSPEKLNSAEGEKEEAQKTKKLMPEHTEILRRSLSTDTSRKISSADTGNETVSSVSKETASGVKIVSTHESEQEPSQLVISDAVTISPLKPVEQTDERNNREAEVTESATNKEQNHVKIVNVSDILSGKVCNSVPVVPQEKDNNFLDDIVSESFEIKSEPHSEPEDEVIDPEEEEESTESTRPLYDVTLTLVDKKKENPICTPEASPEKAPFKVVDNITKVINSVATNFSKDKEETEKPPAPSLNLNRKEITLRPISKLMQNHKQKARKTFPNSPHKMQQLPLHVKRLASDNRDAHMKTTISSTKPPPLISSVSNTASSTISSTNKESMFSLNTPTTPVSASLSMLPPSQTLSISQPIISLVAHQTLVPPNLIIQQTPSGTGVQPTPGTSLLSTTDAAGTSTSGVGSGATQATHVDTSGGVADIMAKAIGEIMCRTMPSLKPRPPGPLTNEFEEAVPSSAGAVTAMLNSVSHRVADYMRGLIKEMLHELGSRGSQEARVSTLELEVESLKYRHNEELVEVKKNLASTLKDVQRTVVEEKAKAVEETRALCETERIRCVDEAKSKQWCAFCLKEAQFYCCWNTSYCDYPCQQNHWPAHMKICSHFSVRNSENGNPGEKAPPMQANQIAKHIAKHTYTNNKSLMKPTRMFMKPPSKPLPMYLPVQRQLQSNTQTITLVESTPGSFEIVGNNNFGNKMVPTSSIKVKPGSVITVSQSPATSSANTNTTGNNNGAKTILLTSKPAALQKQMQMQMSKENGTDKS